VEGRQGSIQERGGGGALDATCLEFSHDLALAGQLAAVSYSDTLRRFPAATAQRVQLLQQL
jgi:hypothetical protein